MSAVPPRAGSGAGSTARQTRSGAASRAPGAGSQARETRRAAKLANAAMKSAPAIPAQQVEGPEALLAASPQLAPPALAALGKRRLRAMLAEGLDILECFRVLKKGGLNIVGEVLRGQGTFYEYTHYPQDDVYDRDTRSQYYYHAHRGMAGENGHFHTFIRLPREPRPASAAHDAADDPDAADEDEAVHLVAISMDAYGWPIGLFATNRWVTGGGWLAAEETIGLLPEFCVDHADPSWPVNRCLSAMFGLFRPHMEMLLRHRDGVIAARAAALPGSDVLEDRELEITGYLPVSVEETVAELRALLGKDGRG
ncbi:MAG: hypothetical protein FJY54_08450 [Betaproteobacteria bacterium]|nr:hypothetical protein [Betaproteobacteria bacterium]